MQPYTQTSSMIDSTVATVSPSYDPAFIITTLAVIVTISFMTLIVLWRIFSKAKQPGWAVLVPFYNLWVYANVAGKAGWLGLLPLLSIPLGVFATLSFIPVARDIGANVYGTDVEAFSSSVLPSVLGMVVAHIFLLVTTLPLVLGIARQFGQSMLFGFVFLYLIPLGYLYLAFGDAWHEATRNNDDEDELIAKNYLHVDHSTSIYPDAPDSLRR